MFRTRTTLPSLRGATDPELHGYTAAMVVFVTGAGLLSLAAKRVGRSPAPLTPLELACVALTTHKLSRILATDDVTRPLRVPFTTTTGEGKHGDGADEGLLRAAGELVSCPFCLGPWIATSVLAGRTFAPTVTRAGVSVFAAVAIADFLHLGYVGAQQHIAPAGQRDS